MEQIILTENTTQIMQEITQEIETKFSQKVLEDLLDTIMTLGIRIIFVAIFFFIGVQVIKLVRKIIRKSMDRTNADQGVKQFLDSFFKVAMYVVLVFMLASAFGVDAASIVAILGSAGVAIGLSLQGSLSNLAGGILILLIKPFKVGDYIVESTKGHEGTVVEIEMFYTKLMTPDNRTIVLPNGNLANNSLINNTTAGNRRCDIIVGISYNSDIKTAKNVLLNLLEQDSTVIQDKEKMVFVDALAASSVNLCVRCWFSNDDFWPGKWRLTENIKYVLDEAKISIPYPQMDVHLPEKADRIGM